MNRTETPALEDGIDNLKNQRAKIINNIKSSSNYNEMDNDEKITYIQRLIDTATSDALQDSDNEIGATMTTAVYFEKSPPYIKNGSLKPFQVDALNWLIRRHHLGVNSILADEMGLGKTLETISLFGYLYHVHDVHGPHLVVAPKSTIANWREELGRWLPRIKVALMGGTKEERESCRKEYFVKNRFVADVLIVSYQVVLSEKNLLKHQNFVYLVLDEAHSAKNEQTRFYQSLKELHASHALFLTGTPLQNTLHELWTLLQFLLPSVFRSDALDELFNSIESDKFADYVDAIRQFLSPFMLRRLKSDVQKELPPKTEIKIFVPMTPFQKVWYRKVLMGDVSVIIGDKVVKSKLNNTMMQLRKVCDHPYLMPGAEPEPNVNGDHIYLTSAKMCVVHKLLQKHLINKGKVLIFSQMTRMLDIIDDYLFYIEIPHHRIDGTTPHEERVEQISDFNDTESDVNVFFVINKKCADTVILYDSDWNPQADIQAMDRAHRIGQTKPVTVYRLIAEGTAEQRLIKVAERKLMLNQLIMQLELNDCLKDEEKKEKDVDIGNIDIDALINTGIERTNALHEEIENETKIAMKGMMNLTNFGTGTDQVNIRELEGKVFGGDDDLEDLEKYKENLKLARTYVLKQPYGYKFKDFQFASKELLQLLDKETQEFKRIDDTFKDDLMCRVLKGENFDDLLNPQFLSPEEEQTKQQLLKEVFSSWDETDYKKWKTAIKRFGKDNTDNVVSYIGTKTTQEVQQFTQTFINRYKEVIDGEKIFNSLFHSEQKRLQRLAEFEALQNAIKERPDPMTILIPYVYYNNTQTDPLVDSLMLRKYAEYGEDWERILSEIREFPLFAFNLYLYSYTSQSVKERIRSLINGVAKTKEKIEKEKEKERDESLAILDKMDDTIKSNKKKKKE
ncbi:Helicase [Entamoeba marina]